MKKLLRAAKGKLKKGCMANPSAESPDEFAAELAPLRQDSSASFIGGADLWAADRDSVIGHNIMGEHDPGLATTDVMLMQTSWSELETLHWQESLIERTFEWVHSAHPALITLWPWANASMPFDQLKLDEKFQEHVDDVVHVISQLINAMFEQRDVKSAIRKIGKRHMYYGSFEFHFKVFIQGFLDTMKLYIGATDHKGQTSEIVVAWTNYWDLVHSSLVQGLQSERNDYISNCIQAWEIAMYEENWADFEKKGMIDCGTILCANAMGEYQKLTGIAMHESLGGSAEFERFAGDTMTAIKSLTSALPFEVSELPTLVQDYARTYVVKGVFPNMVRKAFKHGVKTMLVHVYGEYRLSETCSSAWMKVVEVLVQVIAVCLQEPHHEHVHVEQTDSARDEQQ